MLVRLKIFGPRYFLISPCFDQSYYIFLLYSYLYISYILLKIKLMVMMVIYHYEILIFDDHCGISPEFFSRFLELTTLVS